MINALHLLWIVPISFAAGVLIMAIVAGGDCDPEWYDESSRFRDAV